MAGAKTLKEVSKLPKTMHERLERALKLALEEVERRNARIVGIQLPDGLKHYVPEIVDEFEGRGIETLVSGKATYGACDVDTELIREVDVLLHFAHEPIGIEFDRVVFIPYTYDYDIQAVVSLAERIEEKMISLVATSQYVHRLEDVKEELEKLGYSVSLKRGSNRVPKAGLVLGCNFTAVNRGAEAIVFIGDGLFHPRGAAIYSGKKVYAISPLERKLRIVKEKEVQEFLRRRYALVAKAMDCEVFCILATSKPGQNRVKLALELKNDLRSKGKKCYIAYFDEIRSENFPCDCFVNTACPRIAYDDWKKFRKPVLTPQEMEIVIGKRNWENYEMDEIL